MGYKYIVLEHKNLSRPSIFAYLHEVIQISNTSPRAVDMYSTVHRGTVCIDLPRTIHENTNTKYKCKYHACYICHVVQSPEFLNMKYKIPCHAMHAV